MAVDAEGLLPPAEHLHLAGGVGLDPDGRLGLAHVAEHRPQDQPPHAPHIYPPFTGKSPGGGGRQLG